MQPNNRKVVLHSYTCLGCHKDFEEVVEYQRGSSVWRPPLAVCKVCSIKMLRGEMRVQVPKVQ
jgi:hypothetical protein